MMKKSPLMARWLAVDTSPAGEAEVQVLAQQRDG